MSPLFVPEDSCANCGEPTVLHISKLAPIHVIQGINRWAFSQLLLHVITAGMWPCITAVTG
jgi:hypothetical protein